MRGLALEADASATRRDDRDAELTRALAETSYHRFPGGRKKILALLDVIGLYSPLRPKVLDVGCGNGSLTFPVAALGCEVVGVDMDRGSIEHCRARNRFTNASFVHTDGSLREIDGRFDVIVCSEVLEHLDEPDPLIGAMCGKLAPRGRIFITIPNGYGPREVGGRFEQFLRRRCGLDRPLRALRKLLARFGMASEREKYEMHTSNPEQGHVQRFTRRDILSRLCAHGLRVTGWTNSFVVLSIFVSRSGISLPERLDSWAADRLPAAFASGWFITCERE